mmetsp:Transcript_40548/g.49185  ORF Transcript_40548/g.49185 Transcript_40548/m.49185 type:complete len:344 (-) Transcript_40548:234-1265(-)|eukprot:CAMPEP_0197867270 /NCGR_PEP_ID=MMETSP1438-20131217/44664_1 /TAXON_ID=1461541 /ORGANISM="Pterosperma sp., Strain CCMP1384" /LENGTH=343 /DNA_ID=CAMNT_0043485905 /DNA_START=166 /DNA_END=1197 /DNA_ORIENTATION=+
MHPFSTFPQLAQHRERLVPSSCYGLRLVPKTAANGAQHTPSVAAPSTPFIPSPSEGGGLKHAALHFAGGTLGGMGGIAASYPLDTVKVRMQTTRGIYNGMLDTIFKIAKQEGMKTFYKGVQAPLVSYGLIKATTFGVYGNCLDYFAERAGDPFHTPTFTEIVIAGHLSGFAAAFIMAPSDAIKIHMQAASQGKGVFHESTWGCAKHIVKTEGVGALFRGFTPTALRDGPGMALYYIIYDLCKKYLPGLNEDGSHTALQMMAFGGLSGVVSWLPVYPLDVIKSRIQAPGGNQYKSMLDCAVKSSIAEGPWVLYRGCLPVLFAAVPLHGTVFMVYELWMQHTKDW